MALAYFGTPKAECCGKRHLSILNSHNSTAYYECKKCGKRFFGAHTEPQPTVKRGARTAVAETGAMLRRPVSK